MFPIHHSPFHACFVLHMSTHVCMHHYIESQVVVIAPFVVIVPRRSMSNPSVSDRVEHFESLASKSTPGQPSTPAPPLLLQGTSPANNMASTSAATSASDPPFPPWEIRPSTDNDDSLALAKNDDFEQVDFPKHEPTRARYTDIRLKQGYANVEVEPPTHTQAIIAYHESPYRWGGTFHAQVDAAQRPAEGQVDVCSAGVHRSDCCSVIGSAHLIRFLQAQVDDRSREVPQVDSPSVYRLPGNGMHRQVKHIGKDKGKGKDIGKGKGKGKDIGKGNDSDNPHIADPWITYEDEWENRWDERLDLSHDGMGRHLRRIGCDERSIQCLYCLLQTEGGDTDAKRLYSHLYYDVENSRNEIDNPSAWLQAACETSLKDLKTAKEMLLTYGKGRSSWT